MSTPTRSITSITTAPTGFDPAPAAPMQLVQAWYEHARAQQVREPGVMALASADARGRASNRIVQTIAVRESGMVFASHAGSRKGRELAETGWASGVLYWPELSRQVIVSGPTAPLPEAESEALWQARPAWTHPMSVASQQSAPLTDEEQLRARAEELARVEGPLPRPATWLGYLLEPATVEFWQSAADRLYPRLRYEREGSGWRTQRLQP